VCRRQRRDNITLRVTGRERPAAIIIISSYYCSPQVASSASLEPSDHPTDIDSMSTTEQQQQQRPVTEADQLFFTETDRLLPKATASSSPLVLPKKLGLVRRWVPVIGTLTIVTVSILAVFFGGEGAIIHKAYHHSSFPQAQRIKLQLSTENELTSIIPRDTLAKINRDTKHFADGERDHVSSSSLVNIHAVDHGPNKHHPEDDDGDDGKTRRSLHCTSQLLILRHCDKEVKFNLHGKHFTTDAADSSGNRHCSATGKARSMYIASLFIDPEEYNKLVTSPKDHHHHHEDDEEGSSSRKNNDDIVIPPPVPYIKSSLKKVSKVASKTKPQFPTPIKLYALNEARDHSMGSKHVHENFREIETITPLADKFHLRVESEYGVGDEERLASDYFAGLSRSVRDKYRRKMNRDDDDRRRLDEEETEDLCNGGMTVVNWKHSRMPHLAHALGCGTHEGCPKKYNGKDFDTMWLITYEYTLRLDDDHRRRRHDAPSSGETESKSLVALEKRSIPEDDDEHHHHHHRHLHRHHHHDMGKWKINADLINEGFYPV